MKTVTTRLVLFLVGLLLSLPAGGTPVPTDAGNAAPVRVEATVEPAVRFMPVPATLPEARVTPISADGTIVAMPLTPGSSYRPCPL